MMSTRPDRRPGGWSATLSAPRPRANMQVEAMTELGLLDERRDAGGGRVRATGRSDIADLPRPNGGDGSLPCRACGALLIPALDLGVQPAGGGFPRPDDPPEARLPLRLGVCGTPACAAPRPESARGRRARCSIAAVVPDDVSARKRVRRRSRRTRPRDGRDADPVAGEPRWSSGVLARRARPSPTILEATPHLANQLQPTGCGSSRARWTATSARSSRPDRWTSSWTHISSAPRPAATRHRAIGRRARARRRDRP